MFSHGTDIWPCIVFLLSSHWKSSLNVWQIKNTTSALQKFTLCSQRCPSIIAEMLWHGLCNSFCLPDTSEMQKRTQKFLYFESIVFRFSLFTLFDSWTTWTNVNCQRAIPVLKSFLQLYLFYFQTGDWILQHLTKKSIVHFTCNQLT